MASPHSRTGFTIRQVVVVLVILAVIAALLLPMFQPMPTNSTGFCGSHLKQFGLAFLQYEQDADERMPPGGNAGGNGWAGKVYPFIKSTDVYHCPEDKQAGGYISYAENRNIVNQPTLSFARLSVTVLLYETTTLNCDPSTPEITSGVGLNAPQDSKRHDHSLFQSTYALNFLALDGHVKYLPPEKVSNGPNAVSPNQIPLGLYDETFAIK